MKEVKILNQDDIVEIIADKLNVDISNVRLEVSEGDQQYPRASVYAVIE